MGRKVGAAVPYSVGELRPHITVSPGPRHTITVPSGILIRPTVWPQYTNVTDRQPETLRQDRQRYKPNSITLAGSELAPNMFGASSELASVMEFGREIASSC